MMFDIDENMPGALIGRFGAYAVTREFAEELRQSGFTGFSFGAASIRISDLVPADNAIKRTEFELITPTGVEMVDDLALDRRKRLVASERMFRLLSEWDSFVLEGSTMLDQPGQ
ncbi:hypothetical protein L5G28_02170 [Gordonia sp. HY285]|uniref:hypothetical protein n=1 Tax=Gordonia liuliyuniae TaxID=2911517 RepID=UPI001F40888C|nr:hypothetical protein [Gordonia liuliyuniae]MCF8608972.1 hypothetical protein [Gordonia liuliyuniae]